MGILTDERPPRRNTSAYLRRAVAKGQNIYAITAPLAAAFAKRTFRHLSSNMAKHPRTTSIKAAPVCTLHYDTDHPLLAAYTVIAVQLPSKIQIPHGDERPIGLRGTAFLRFQNRGQ